MMPDIEATIAMARRVQAMPYAWPAPPDDASARTAGAGSCASKHTLLAEEFAAIGLQSLPLLVVGSLVLVQRGGAGARGKPAPDRTELKLCPYDSAYRRWKILRKTR